LLIALGTERASQIIRLLDDEEVAAVAAAIAEARAVPREEADAILREMAGAPRVRGAKGGPEVAREMLRAAFGPDEGERRFFRSIPNATAHHFAFLNEMEPTQLQSVLKGEPPAAVALLLAHVDRDLAARTIALLPADDQAVVARRIARMGTLSRDVVLRVEEAIREKIRRRGTDVTQEIDGESTLAAILRHLRPSQGDAIVRELRDADIDLGESVRRKLYTADLVVRLSDRHLADLLREFSEREIALFLKGKEQDFRRRILSAVSERRAQMVSEEYAHLGAQRRGEVDRVTAEILERMRELEEEGSILVPREGDRYI
jgi:flagellar motor switch protein FliG